MRTSVRNNEAILLKQSNTGKSSYQLLAPLSRMTAFSASRRILSRAASKLLVGRVGRARGHGVHMSRLLHKLPDAALQVVDARSHLVDFGDDRLRHGLEAHLHLQQQVLHERRQVRGLLRGGVRALMLRRVRHAMDSGVHRNALASHPHASPSSRAISRAENETLTQSSTGSSLVFLYRQTPPDFTLRSCRRICHDKVGGKAPL
ncbi:hypothetical protein M758_UG196200 [Ceratodon purpureus]|nr:hypothetical protein M758_N023900 [Ceratodon purpureus]KAG0595775.1 hypothetical protein M758_UG196200 [Ceratodon purpureus]